MAMSDVVPVPSIEQIQKLQLLRTVLVKFIDWKNFDEVVQGCFVRVLLELRGDDRRTTEATSDFYYIATVKGARKGPTYNGFSWDGVSTEWHIIIELPPCFKATPNGNVVQLNSISNTAFKPNEYNQWAEMTKRSGGAFITSAQIDMRHQLLMEHFARANVSASPMQKRRRTDQDEQRSERIMQMKKEAEEHIRKTHVVFPSQEALAALPQDQLAEIERTCVELVAASRNTLSERRKCHICKIHISTVICYPCKHQVLCTKCAPGASECPAPQCGKRIEDKFESYSS